MTSWFRSRVLTESRVISPEVGPTELSERIGM